LFFGLNSVLLTVISILICVGVNSLIIIGGIPIIESRWKGGMTSSAPLWTVFVGLTLFRLPGNQVKITGSYDGIIRWQL